MQVNEDRGETLSSTDIMEVLPHRYPFLLVDKVIACYPGQEPNSRVGRRIRAIKNVTINEPFFTGHFPDHPVMPGVLLIEVMAQAGALAYFRKEDPKMDVAIAAVNSAKFRRPVVPGDTLRIEAEIVKEKGPMKLIRGEIFVEDKLACQAEIMAYVSDKKDRKNP